MSLLLRLTRAVGTMGGQGAHILVDRLTPQFYSTGVNPIPIRGGQTTLDFQISNPEHLFILLLRLTRAVEN